MAVTIKDIARLAGVSTSTVSKVINNRDSYIGEETQARVRRIIAEQNYRPSAIARSLTTQRTSTLGIVVPDILNPYFGELARACDDAAREAGYLTIVVNSDDIPDQEQTLISWLVGRGVDGLVLTNSNIAIDQKLLSEISVPVVTMNRYVDAFPQLVATIDTDLALGAYRSARHLLDLGHRDIAFLCGTKESRISQERHAGFARALNEAQCPIKPELVRFGTFQHEFGFQSVSDMVKQHEFTAMCCMSDMLAIGACQALRQAGRRVPDDCAVMGFDNIFLASMLERPLSTVDRSISDTGKMAVDALVTRLSGTNTGPAYVLVEPEIIERATTARVP